LKEKRFLGLAYLASLVLHLVLIGVVMWVPMPAEQGRARAEEPEILVTLLPDEEFPEDPSSEMPTRYTSIPDRQATETPPDDPEFLSLHHSQAADNTEGGDGNSPTAEETWIAPQVAIQKEELSGAEGVQYAPQPLPETRSGRSAQETGQGGQDDKKVESPVQEGAGQWALPGPATARGQDTEKDQQDQEKADQPNLEDWWGGESPSILKEGDQGAVGDRGFDFNQKARGSVGSGVAIDGDFSLNTYEWNYAPWMRRFENELHRHWVAPYAYRLGVISGKTLIKIVIEKDGRPSVMEIVETDGHQSLHDASLAALKAFAPYAPLPAHFPEENLVITLGLHYPAWR
jgi:hypothetical protein